MNAAKNLDGPERAIFSRRTLLKTIATAAAGEVLGAQRLPSTVEVTGTEGSKIPQEFLGLSFETEELATPERFSPDNHELVNYFRTLGPQGVLRLGGNATAYSVWASNAAPEPLLTKAQTQSVGRDPKLFFPITQTAIDNLGGFLRATGWKVIYGLNVISVDADTTADEADHVSAAVGDRLAAFQFGNEPENLRQGNKRWGHPLTYEEYIAKWKLYSSAVRARLPKAPLAGPDTALKLDWVTRFAADVGHDITALTTHYYEGPATDPNVNLDFLEHHRGPIDNNISAPLQIAQRLGVPYRLTEANSFYFGGKAGLSNTFASALWGADFMLFLAQKGVAGINFHGGGEGYYTHIAESAAKRYSARPLYYGMLFARQFLGTTLLGVSLNSPKDLTAYAAQSAQDVRIAVFNRETERVSIDLSVPNLHRQSVASVWRLKAPSPSATAGVTLANATVSAEGTFKPLANEQLELRNGKAKLGLDAFSAALITINGRLGKL
jgi:hypothetical protein